MPFGAIGVLSLAAVAVILFGAQHVKAVAVEAELADRVTAVEFDGSRLRHGSAAGVHNGDCVGLCFYDVQVAPIGFGDVRLADALGADVRVGEISSSLLRGGGVAGGSDVDSVGRCRPRRCCAARGESREALVPIGLTQAREGLLVALGDGGRGAVRDAGVHCRFPLLG